MGRRWGIIPTRGVYQGLAFSGALTSGSSPLARGLQAGGGRRLASAGIIPARAGFTRSAESPRRPGSDHPRSRGVYQLGPRGQLVPQGSSPLARGLLHVVGVKPALCGIIPARAGFTGPSTSKASHFEDHPRSRGVYSVPNPATSRKTGSSPLARGLRLPWVYRRQWSRIIPARAGFTVFAARRPSPRRDHPRSRGVYTCWTLAMRAGLGSSPLARGLRLQPVEAIPGSGIIPARAGFTRHGPPCRRYSRDHPRSRGVYHSVHFPDAPGEGSSPLARGLHSQLHVDTIQRRIIPARAGFTGRTDLMATIDRDHPRSRGVYQLTPTTIGGHDGSSPLARGLPQRLHRVPVHPGIIPARAGFTSRRGRPRSRCSDHPRSRGVYGSILTISASYHWIIPARAGFT